MKRGLWDKCIDTLTSRTSQTSGQSSSGNSFADKDCKDFKTQAEAREFFISQGGPASDPHKLDSDKDGKVCESLP